MANSQRPADESASFFPPGTSLLVQGMAPLIKLSPYLIHADGGISNPDQQGVMLDPVPSRDPNEPLVGRCTTFGGCS